MTTASTILLAGGRSQRMGVDKATVVIAGEPLWQRQVRILKGLRPATLWVSARTMPLWCSPEIPVVLDKPPSQGPLSGVAAGLARLQTSHLLVLAIDMPGMTEDHLQKLRDMARPGIGIIPSHGDYFEPLCAVYPAEALTAAEDALNQGDASLQNFARSLLARSQAQVYDLTPHERSLYLNMNTPSDLPPGR